MNIYLSYSYVRQRGVSISNMSSENLEVVIYFMILFCTNCFIDFTKKGNATNKPSYICAHLFLLTTMIR